MSTGQGSTPRAGAGASPARAPWGTISREQIVAAAIASVHRDGYEQLTIRGLASTLGVSPMSLYRHVRDKDDLLDEVVDRLLVRVWRPRSKGAGWRAWVSEAAERLRRFLVAQPAALHVYLRHPVVSPTAAARMDAMLAVLRDALGSDDAAHRAYAAIHTYTIGFAALEASRARQGPARPERDERARQLRTYTSGSQFAEGLGYLLDGIEVDLVPAGRSAPR